MSLKFRASRFCIRASETGEALAQRESDYKTLLLYPCTNLHIPPSLFAKLILFALLYFRDVTNIQDVPSVLNVNVFCHFRMYWHVPTDHVTNFAGDLGCYNISLFGRIVASAEILKY